MRQIVTFSLQVPYRIVSVVNWMGGIVPITVMKVACTAGLAATPPVISGTISFPALMNKTIIAALVSGLCGMAHAQDAAELPVVTVFGSSAGPASAVDSAADTTHTDIAWKDYPASIQTIPAEVLKDRGVTRIDQLVETVSGVYQYGLQASRAGELWRNWRYRRQQRSGAYHARSESCTE